MRYTTLAYSAYLSFLLLHHLCGAVPTGRGQPGAPSRKRQRVDSVSEGLQIGSQTASQSTSVAPPPATQDHDTHMDSPSVLTSAGSTVLPIINTLGGSSLRRSSSRSSVRSSSLGPGTPADVPFPLVTPQKLSAGCALIQTRTQAFMQRFERKHLRLPHENTLSEIAIDSVDETGAGRVMLTFISPSLFGMSRCRHQFLETQNAEGESGADYRIQFSLNIADFQSWITEATKKLTISDPTPQRSGSTGPGPSPLARSSQLSGHIHASGQASIGPASSAGPSIAGASSGGIHKFIVAVQAKSYHKNEAFHPTIETTTPTTPVEGEPDRIAKFSYRRNYKQGEPTPAVQMKHLRNHATELQTKNPDAVVFAAYITYAPEGFSIITLDDLESMCLAKNNQEPCTAPSDALDKALSLYFRTWDDQQRNRRGGHCYLEVMVDHALKRLAQAHSSQQPVLP
ncbi:hypothetical protein FRC17_010832 [Serendipita sp. 399]|nr:hypothetical protein FRC17_010832 [Serendipita sp. 399]